MIYNTRFLFSTQFLCDKYFLLLRSKNKKELFSEIFLVNFMSKTKLKYKIRLFAGFSGDDNKL